ncbi:Maf family nucleotide pyrophosphatase [Alteromonas sp. ASW11-19]|uniref:dTTP/UTP pyrophosphatase n=1 Tax=Alteromonas salexigens TaxID=2982530 RepID=A0ABT2VN03_9ALTE|nr:Maf family protein [Alteromonas salexigens]MCU7554682.1 Maf family nucleotide pyrophosphatase [Alteromonas salexigens]
MSKSLILASASPRRTALLNQLGIAHTVRPVDIDESRQGEESPLTQVTRLASEKARAAFALLDDDEQTNHVVLASDTLIALDGESLGKPRDLADSRRMLQALSGRTHDVLTAISARDCNEEVTECIRTKVEFAPLTDEDIVRYWQTGEPSDKAGSYAIQGIGGQFVKAIEGSASAVVGLPLYETRLLLSRFGVQL